jgi:hypothetical protein
MFLPTIIVQESDLTILDTALFTRGSAIESSVNTISVVIFFKQKQFPLQITGTPEKYSIEILSSYCADQSFDKGMR